MLQLFKREDKEDTIRSGVRALVACKMQLSMHFQTSQLLLALSPRSSPAFSTRQAPKFGILCMKGQPVRLHPCMGMS